ncbi:MAG: carboxypeptidase regulatory-like domain-containing protein [Acidobacteria bacterium]|nr:carboxypeptidase regulatory-like domain-containing protein [Acidobacteriota bacterium]
MNSAIVRVNHILSNAIAILLLAVCGIVLCTPDALAQSGAGSIQGTVQDATGAVFPNAAIHVVNQATGVATDTQSNKVGFYQVPNLFTGTYVVSITAPGMSTYQVKVELQVGQNATINPVLTTGSVNQQVSVDADVIQLVTTDSGTISSTLENSRINQLPMNGRKLVTLTGMTTPGLEGSGQRASGLMPEALEYVADGVPLTNRQNGGVNVAQAQLPDPDAVQEVQMITTNPSAQFATPAAGIITTKSGTNSLHGSLFETMRNNAIGVAKSRSDPANFAAPHLVRNEFGVSLGGPIVLPRIYDGRNKSFWFFAYERYSLASYTNGLANVPTTAMRQGDFSGLVNSSGVLQQLYDPATTQTGASNYKRTPFTNNQIPMSRLAPMTKLLYAITPTPTSADNPLINNNLRYPKVNNAVVPTYTFRLDHTFNEDNKAYLRFTYNGQSQQSASTPPTVASGAFPAAATGISSSPATNYGAAFGYTHIFSPTFFAETVLSQQWFAQHSFSGSNPYINYDQMLGLPNNFSEIGFPTIASGAIMPYPTTMGSYGMTQTVSNIDENLTKTIGRHQLQFGGRYRYEQFGYYSGSNAGDNAAFGTYATALVNPASGANYSATPNTGYTDADLFLGAASSYTVSTQPPYIHVHAMEFDGYFQDNFHVTKNLTFNLGLRYEAHPGAWTMNGLTESFDLKNNAQVLANPVSYYIDKGYTTQAIVTNLQNLGVRFETPQEAGYPNKMLKDYNFTFGPRFGFAYTPFKTAGTVVRGGYGRYIYPIPLRYSVVSMSSVNAPWNASYSQSYIAANQSPDGLPNYLLRAPQTVIAGLNSSGVVNSSSLNAITPGFSLKTLDPNYAPDMVTSANVTVEQPLKGNSALRVSWVFTHGTNLDHYYYYNNAPSTFVWEMAKGVVPPTGAYSATATRPYDQTKYGNNILDVKNGWSNDNSLQVNYQRLFYHGFAYQVTYVWSKAMRFGGNYFRDGNTYPAQNYLGAMGNVSTMTSPYGSVVTPSLPPARPNNIASYAEWKELDRYQGYMLDSAIPKQHITFNGIVELPFGRGKTFFGRSNRFVNELIGGFQIAGDASIFSQVFQPSTSYWGSMNPIHVNKHKQKISDCRSGVCYPSYLWFNGYIAPTAQSKIDGLPSDYQPFQTPIDNTPGTANYGTNNVVVTLPNGTQNTVAYSPGPAGAHPYSKTFLDGPVNWTADASLFKVFPITETVNLRFNVDAFNVFNVQGYNNPSSTDGVQSLRSSFNTPRQLQLTARLTF